MYQLLLNTWKLLLQAFGFVWAIMLWWVDAIWQLRPHSSTCSLPIVGWGREWGLHTLPIPNILGVRNRRFAGVWAPLCSCWHTGVLSTVFWSHVSNSTTQAALMKAQSRPDPVQTYAVLNHLHTQTPCLLHPTNAVWVAGSLKHWTSFSVHPVLWIQLNNKPLTWSVRTIPESNQLFGPLTCQSASLWEVFEDNSYVLTDPF